MRPHRSAVAGSPSSTGGLSTSCGRFRRSSRRVDRSDRVAGRKLRPHRVANVLELRVSVRMAGSFERLAIRLKAVPHLAQQLSNHACASRVPKADQFCSESTNALARPPRKPDPGSPNRRALAACEVAVRSFRRKCARLRANRTATARAGGHHLFSRASAGPPSRHALGTAWNAKSRCDPPEGSTRDFASAELGSRGAPARLRACGSRASTLARRSTPCWLPSTLSSRRLGR